MEFRKRDARTRDFTDRKEKPASKASEDSLRNELRKRPADLRGEGKREFGVYQAP